MTNWTKDTSISTNWSNPSSTSTNWNKETATPSSKYNKPVRTNTFLLTNSGYLLQHSGYKIAITVLDI
jgi:hypothetical protein